MACCFVVVLLLSSLFFGVVVLHFALVCVACDGWCVHHAFVVSAPSVRTNTVQYSTCTKARPASARPASGVRQTVTAKPTTTNWLPVPCTVLSQATEKAPQFPPVLGRRTSTSRYCTGLLYSTVYMRTDFVKPIVLYSTPTVQFFYCTGTVLYLVGFSWKHRGRIPARYR